LYVMGILQTFVFNKSWTFRYAGPRHSALWRHVVLYVVGYLIQLLLLILMVDTLGWRHEWVMAGVVLLMSAFFFLGQKYWVFRRSPLQKIG
jgi:putative flippase GtrA